MAILEQDSRPGQMKRTVSFSNIEVSLFPHITGDHPDCRSGPPISIGWKPFERTTESLDEYEKNRLPRRTMDEFYVSDSVRCKLLLKSGIPLYQIMDAGKLSRELARKRRATNSISFAKRVKMTLNRTRATLIKT